MFNAVEDVVEPVSASARCFGGLGVTVSKPFAQVTYEGY